MKNVLITGSEGFIGTNLKNNFLDLVNFTCLDKQIRPEQDLSSSWAFNYIDRSEPFDSIVHLAALTGILDCLDDPKQVFVNNILATFNVLEFARKCNIPHVVFASSGAVMSDYPSIYGSSKMCGENLCNAYHSAYNIKCSILRFGNVYGPHSMHKGSVIHKFIRQILEHEPMTVRGDGSQSRTFIYIDDIVDTISELIKKPQHGTFAVSAPMCYTINHIANTLAYISESTTGYLPLFNYIDAEPEAMSSNNFSHSATISLEDGLTKTFNWYLENYEVQSGRTQRNAQAA